MKAEETTDRLYSGRAFQRDDWKVRISKTVGRCTGGGLWQLMGETSFLYDGWNVVSEICDDQSQITTNFYVWGLDLSGSLQGAGGIGGLLAAQLGTNSVLYTYDGNGNVSELINTLDGTIAAHYEYSPFGEVLVATGDLASKNPFQFSTKYFDAETGLNNYGYRYYSPSLGRFVNRDPIGEEGGDNVYEFVANNPLSACDYLGQKRYFFEGCCDGKSYNTRWEGCCNNEVYKLRTHCCEGNAVVEKASIWVCRRKLKGPDSNWPKIGPLSHTFIVCENPFENPNTTEKYGKQPRLQNDASPFTGPGHIEREPYSDFSDCSEKKVCPKEKQRMCQEGATESPYILISPWHNCHAWGNCRSF